VLYTASSAFIAPGEPAFVEQWVRALRAHGGVLRDAGLLVRPHPLAASGFRDLVIDDPQVAIWPRHGEFPLGDAARQNFFDSIFHSAAVVGINTSAQIEAAIVGRPVHTVLAGEFRDTQQGTLHFRYLADRDFGHLRIGTTLAEHADQLARSVEHGDEESLNERFLLRFVRPFGLDAPATPVAVDAIEQLAAAPPGPARAPLGAGAVRLALRPLAAREKRARQRQKRAAAAASPLDELKRTTRELVRGGATVVAGPWEGDEIGELLYWIPFLRWSTRTAFNTADRLVVVARPGTAAWYSGLSERVVTEEEIARAAGGRDVVRLEPGIVDRHRRELAQHDPHAPLQARRLEFALPPAPGALPLDRPPSICIHLGDRADPELVAAAGTVADEHPVQMLDGLDRAEQSAAIERSGGFFGAYGALAYAAVLAGVPAVAVARAGEVDEDDLRLAAALPKPPFGRLEVLPAAEAASRVVELARAGSGAPAPV
jgi:hypothetical protein